MTKAEKKYLEILRKKSGQERLRISVELRNLVLKLATAEIKSRNPNISSKELQQLLFKRIYGFDLPTKISSK